MNITYDAWDSCNFKLNDAISLSFNRKSLNVPYATTFGEINVGKPLIIKDDYGRVEIAINQGSFAKKYQASIGDEVIIIKK